MEFEYESLWFIFGGGLFLFMGIKGLLKAYENYSLRTLIRDTPTAKIRSMPVGPVELKGKAKSYDNQYLKAPLDGKKCLFVEFIIERWKSEKSNGKKKGKWVKEQHIKEANDFYLADGTGKALIKTNGKIGCEFSKGRTKQWKSKYPEKNEQLYSYIKDHQSIPNKYIANPLNEEDSFIKSTVKKIKKSGSRYRFTQKIIREEDDIYIYGHAERLKNARENKEADMKITEGNRDFFFISDLDEERLMKKLSFKIAGSFIFSTILIGGGVLFLYQLFISL